MLQDIRDNSQGLIAKVIVGFIVAIFALWGVDSIIGGFVRTPPVAEVNGEEINELQLQASTQNLVLSIGAGAENLDQTLIEQLALNQLIEELVLRQSAANAGLAVSDLRLDRAIVETPSFQINGQFDPEFAVRTMASQGYTIPAYRAALADRIQTAQLANAFSGSNFATEAELERLAGLSSQSRDFRYLSITMGTRTLGTAIPDEEIEAYYNDNSEQFTEPEKVSVQYVMLDKNVIAQEIEVSEEDLLALYEEERNNFEGAAEKRASHILFEVAGDVSEEDALALAENARQRLDGGETFEDLALELSDDTVSAEEGGDIGFSDGSAFPVAIEDALEVLQLNEVSGPVVTEFGVHLVKLTQDAENVFAPFEEVRDRLERESKSSEVDLIYGERLADLSNLAFETPDLADISEQMDLAILGGEPFGRGGGSGVFANQAVIEAAFSDEVLLEGNNSDVIELNDSQSVVLRVEEFIEAALIPLEEVSAEIAVILRTDMERDAVRDLGNQVLNRLEAGEDISTLLEQEGLEWIEANGTQRGTNTVNREIMAQAFSMPRPEDDPVIENLILSNGTFAIIELTAVNAGSMDSLSEEEQLAMEETILLDLGEADFQAYLSYLRETADIQARNPEQAF